MSEPTPLPTTPALLSVVVPIYNVEDYLVACLESIAEQSYAPLEVILVDDGSPDRSGALAEDFAAARPGWQVLHVDNGGLGRARNIGFDHSTGEYVTFVDSDDIVPTDAYERMVGALEETGSDFVCGAVKRFDGAKVWNSGLHARAIKGTRLRTTIRETPSLIYDTTAWNKVFRRSFLERHGLRFPEGVFYEDIPLTVPAHFLADQVDVLAEDVYWWRERQTAEQSITQRRAEVRNLVDRMAAVSGVDAFLDARGDLAGKRLHETKALGIDVPLFVDVIHEGSDEFVRTLVELGGAYLRQCDQSVIAAQPPLRRLQYHLMMQGMEAELREVGDFVRIPGNRGRFVRRGRRLYADLPFLGDSSKGIPDAVYDVTRSQPLVTGVRDVWWEGDDLHVDGHAFIHRVSDHGPLSTLHRLQLRRVGAAANDRMSLPARRTSRPDLTARTTGAEVTYDGAGFEATIRTAELELAPGEDEVEYELLAQVASPVAQRGASVGRPELGRGRHPRRRLIRSDVLAVPGYREPRSKFRLVLRRLPAVLVAAGIDDGRLALRFRALGEADLSGSVVHLRPESSMTGATAALEERSGAWHALLPLEGLRLAKGDGAARVAQLWIVGPEDGVRATADRVDERVTRAISARGAEDAQRTQGTRAVAGVSPVELDPSVAEIQLDAGRRLLTLRAAGLEGAIVVSGKRRPSLDAFDWQPDGLSLRGRTHGVALDELELVGKAERRRVPVAVTGDQWSAFLPGSGPVGGANLRWLTPGRWAVVAPGPNGPEGDLSLVVSADAEEHLGERGSSGPVTLLLRTSPKHRLSIVVDAGGDWSERGKYRTERARRYTYRASRLLPLQDEIFFEAWKGRQYSDNPRAIDEELARRGDPRPRIWAVQDHGVEVPDGVRTVIAGSADYYRHLARARWLVSNDSMRPAYVKRSGSSYGQTWHGTPLKRIGFDIENLQMSNRNYLVQFEREKDKWDALVSPNAFSTEIFRRAFRYGGRVLEIGYPRNDVFFRPEEREQRAAVVRARLGLPDDKQIVLYAPTWRDNVFDASGQYQFLLKLDLEALHRERGDDTVVLIRGHQLVAASIDTAMFDGFVRNVSLYPDISDLYLVADVLVTDYSSVMFDFVNTGRPMVFFTYDLESYRDELRGFYFDFEAEAPGPLVTHTSGVIDALRDLDAVQAEYADRYAHFRDRFASLEDGNAGARFVDQFLGE